MNRCKIRSHYILIIMSGIRKLLHQILVIQFSDPASGGLVLQRSGSGSASGASGPYS